MRRWKRYVAEPLAGPAPTPARDAHACSDSHTDTDSDTNADADTHHRAGGTTFTISSAGVSPKSLTVPAGTRVTFTNSDIRTHDMESDPHPVHTDCPEINQAGFMRRRAKRS